MKLSLIIGATAAFASTAFAQKCTSDLLVDDWASQSRLTFLFYNAQLQPTSDDGTMKSVVVGGAAGLNRVTYTPQNANSYWYSQLNCVALTEYNGIGATMKAPAGTTFSVDVQTSTNCDGGNPTSHSLTSTQLGIKLDGTATYHAIPFSKFGLKSGHITSVVFSELSKPIVYGPLALYCGATPKAYPLPQTAPVIEPTATVPATVGPSGKVIDTFQNVDSNNLGFYHGGDDETTYRIAGGKITFNTKGDSDLSWYTQITNKCADWTKYNNGYLHIAYTGSSAFSIALQQHNSKCDENVAPYPFTWDDVEASRYTDTAKKNIYVPLSHFKIDKTKTVGFALKGFFTTATTTVSRIEIISTVPQGFKVPSKIPTAPLLFACTRPNSFAFAIDDGSPDLAQRVLQIVKKAGIKVTFFTVGAGLLDPSTNFSSVYNEMKNEGHQIAYHSYTHPPMEGLPSLAAVDWELKNDIEAVKKTLGGYTSKYFRPPFGTEGSRVRQRLAALIPGSKFVSWSVDVQDYLWAESKTPEKQLTAFKSDVNKGGNLVVMHYLYESTVDYLPQFIAYAKATGKKLMRVDQCMEDPNAPPL